MLHALPLSLLLSLSLGTAAPGSSFAPAGPRAETPNLESRAGNVGRLLMLGDSTRADGDIREVALRHAGEIQHCYETDGLKVNPSLSGTVEVEVTVLATGLVDSVAVSSSDLRGPGEREVEGCISMVVRNWRFDRGPYDTETIVYPFTLIRDPQTLLRAAQRS